MKTICFALHETPRCHERSGTSFGCVLKPSCKIAARFGSNHHRHENYLICTPPNSQVPLEKWNLIWMRCETKMQDRSMVCYEPTIGMKTSFFVLHENHRCHGQRGTSFRCVVKLRCKIGARFATNLPQARKLVSLHSMKLIGVMGKVEHRLDAL